MALINCPECGHEISTAAVACPNCGRPISARPTIERNVVVADPPRGEGFPKWAVIPLVVFGGLMVFVFFLFMSRESGEDPNLRFNVNTTRPANSLVRSERERSETTLGTATQPSSVTIPDETQPVTVPGSQTSVANGPAGSGRGTVVINAKVATRTGQPQPVRDEKFYLLDKDLESILSDADLEPIAGQTLINSFGLAVMYPERYSEFHRAAMRAINDHIKYSGTTDNTGKAQLGSVEPDSYYLFGVTKTASGFAVWSSPVTINNGENVLNLAPQRLTEIQTTPSG